MKLTINLENDMTCGKTKMTITKLAKLINNKNYDQKLSILATNKNDN